MKAIKVIRWILGLVLSCVMWLFLWRWIYEDGHDIFDLSWLLVYSYLLLVSQIVIHEAGHALFGKMTGYKMTSFRVLSFMWSWYPDGRIVFQKSPVAGLSGQCLMAPPEYRENKWPFRWYLSGGCLANLIASLLALIFFERTWYLSIFSFMGFLIVLLNGLPDGHNDGKNILLASQRKEYRYLLHLELKMNDLSNRGMTLAEMPRKYFEKIPTGSKRTHLDDYHDLLRVYFFLDTKQWEKLQSELDMLWEQLPNVAPVYQLAVKAEMLFYLLIFQSNDPRIEEIWQDKKFRKMMRNEDSVTQRVKAAYLYSREKNLPEALDMLDSADNYLEKLPTRGRKKREMQLIHWFQGLMIERGHPSHEIETVQPLSPVQALNADEEKNSLLLFILMMIGLVAIAYWL